MLTALTRVALRTRGRAICNVLSVFHLDAGLLHLGGSFKDGPGRHLGEFGMAMPRRQMQRFSFALLCGIHYTQNCRGYSRSPSEGLG